MPKPTRLRERFESRLLVPGDRDLRAGARRREAALPRAHLECRPGSVHRHRQSRRAPRWSPKGCCGPHFFSGWGIRTVATRRGALQSDVLSQRLDLAARQRADRARASRATDSSSRSTSLFEGLFERRDLHGPAAAAGAVLRFPAPARPRADALSRRLLAAGLGQRHAVRAARSVARARVRPGDAARSVCAIRACRHFSTR